MRHRLFPGAVMNCPLCDGEEEDCSHLFFTCPMVQEAWQTAGVARLVTSSDEEFWSSLIDRSFRRETEWRRVFPTLWAIWIHRNEVMFRGVAPSGDFNTPGGGGCLLYSWNRGRLRPFAPVTIDLYPCVIISITSRDTNTPYFLIGTQLFVSDMIIDVIFKKWR